MNNKLIINEKSKPNQATTYAEFDFQPLNLASNWLGALWG